MQAFFFKVSSIKKLDINLLYLKKIFQIIHLRNQRLLTNNFPCSNYISNDFVHIYTGYVILYYTFVYSDDFVRIF